MRYIFTIILTEEKSGFVARCAELGVVSQGKTKREAENNLKEAVELYLEDDNEALALISTSKPVIKTAGLSYA